MDPIFSVNVIDYIIIIAYVALMMIIGWSMKKHMKTGEDFFLSGRSLPTWITALAFLSANLGALEVIGMVANSAKYGIVTVHFYWLGAIPAMIFLGVFMMPFYYGSKVRTVPEYLKLRYNEAARGLNAISFGVMTVLMSGISLYAMALLFKLMLGWSLTTSIVFAAVVVLLYVFWGGLSSSIYNEVIQFFLIWLGLLPIVFLGLKEVGGVAGLAGRLQDSFIHAWKYMGTSQNPLGVNWVAITLGLGFVLSFGYWTTDFLVVQRAMASRNIHSSRMTPIIAAFPKMLVPIIVVVPGLIALLVLPEFSQAAAGQTPDYNSALILLMKHYLPNGVLGLAVTALLASFMSGMAGNVTAFNSIWTYDIYSTYIKKGRSDAHYLKVGRYTTVIGILISIGTAYIVQFFPNLMDYMQLLFSFINAPLFATFLLGMFWAGATGWGGFFGLLSGILAAAAHYIIYKAGIVHYISDMAANYYQAWWAWLTAFLVTIIVSLFTKKRKPEELVGLVYKYTPRSRDTVRMLARPEVWGSIAMVIAFILNIIFW